MPKNMHNDTRSGFTVVELAVVIVVLAILATVVVFSVGDWKTRVATSEVKSDLNGVKAAMENVRNFSNGYPLTVPNTFQASPNVTITYYAGDATTYCIDAKSKTMPSVYYFIDSTETGGEPVKGTCAGGEEA